MNHSLNPTTHRLLMGSVMGLATLLAVQTVDAQPRWGTPKAPQSGACFYREVNFRGSYFCASAGEDIALLASGMNDQISSIRTFGNVEVEVFQTERFVGRSAWFEKDVPNLMSTGWNDQVSSLRVGRGGRYGRGMNEARGGRNGGGNEVDLQPRWGRPRAPQSGACFYRDVNFRGSYFCASVGDDIPALAQGMNNQVSSIRTFGNAEVEVFQAERYVGRSAWFGNNVRNLRSTGWNDQLSSLRVGRAGRYGRGMNEGRGGRNGGGNEVDLQPRWGNPRAPQSGACFYRDVNFQGTYFCAAVGEDFALLTQGMNDSVSSIRTFGNAEVEVFQGARFSGPSAWFENDVSNLRSTGWNDQLSSLRVGRAGNYGRGLNEPRGGRDNPGRNDVGPRTGGRDGANGSAAVGRNEQEPDVTIRRVYQDILNREPDSAGMGIYRDRMLNDRWSEQQVRDALVQSPEYRNRNVMTREKAAEIVARVYRAELNRDPGPAAQGWVDKVLAENWTEAMLTAEIRKSPEYRSKR